MVIQWWRIYLPMQEIQVQSPVWEATKPMGHNNWGCALEACSAADACAPKVHTLQQEKSLQWECLTPGTLAQKNKAPQLLFPNNSLHHNGLKREGQGEKEGGLPSQQACFKAASGLGWQTAQSLLLSTRGFADQIRATLEKAAAVARDISSNSFLANELEGSRGSQERIAPLGCAGRPLLPWIFHF